MPTPLKIAIVTATRAEYGILRWILEEVKADPHFQLQLIVTGSHLSPEFDYTYRQIEADGFRADRKIEMLVSSDSKVGVAKSAGLAVLGFTEALHELQPDALVVLGDRYEIMSIAMVAHFLRVPVVHIHGGEKTAGSLDDSIRHAITKLASLHLVSCEQHARRVRQLGEEKESIFTVGAPSLETLQRLPLIPKEQIFDELKIDLAKKTLLFTFHPETSADFQVQDQLGEIFSALLQLDDSVQIVATKSNADHQGRAANTFLENVAQKDAGKIKVVGSLGQLRFFSLLRSADLFIGNSSAGLIEAPQVGTPTLNLGNRQLGREAGPSVFHCPISAGKILASIRSILGTAKSSIVYTNPYAGEGSISQEVCKILKRTIPEVKTKNFVDHRLDF